MKANFFPSAYTNHSVLKHGMIGLLWMVGIIYTLSAQVNLVQNPSFEEYTTCPITLGQISKAKHWHTPIAGGGNSPDYYHTCTNGIQMLGIPKQSQAFDTSYQVPKNGNAYIRLGVYTFYSMDSTQLLREYPQTKLSSNLINSRSYCFTMFVSLCDFSHFAIDGIGSYFDDGSIVAPNGDGFINKTPQVASTTGVILKDTMEWMKISGSFIANGTEQYLTIGNFRNNVNTNKELLYGTPLQGSLYSLYYIDDVSVIPSDLPAYAGEDTVISPGDSVFIGRQPEIGLECVWHSNGQQVGTGAGIWVKPTQTTSYIVTQDLCGNIQQDTVIVYVFPTSVQVPLYLQSVQLYPNPAHHMITLSLPQAQGQQLGLQLFSPEGKKVWQGAMQSVETNIPLPAESGVYFLEIRDDATGGRVVKKVVRE